MISAVSKQLKDELAPIIGDVKIKNLFAGYGIFYSEMMFAIYQNGSLYLRAEDELAQYLESLGVHQIFYFYQKRKTRSHPIS